MVSVQVPDSPHSPREGQSDALDWLLERIKEENLDDPSIGQWVSFTASPYPNLDEDDKDGWTMN